MTFISSATLRTLHIVFSLNYCCQSHIAGMDTSGLPVPDAIHPLLEQLQEALVLEVKYQPNLQLPNISQVCIQIMWDNGLILYL